MARVNGFVIFQSGSCPGYTNIERVTEVIQEENVAGNMKRNNKIIEYKAFCWPMALTADPDDPVGPVALLGPVGIVLCYAESNLKYCRLSRKDCEETFPAVSGVTSRLVSCRSRTLLLHIRINIFLRRSDIVAGRKDGAE